MPLIVLLANGLLQQMIQSIAYGAALGIHPLAVLIVTIAGGALLGTVGLILAAPLTAAATEIAGGRGGSLSSPRRRVAGHLGGAHQSQGVSVPTRLSSSR
ncbi:MAG: AI-2E family transporter [Actinobacteria bacterium]|nr:AI-2E family transporter [Actinomycetota bacterium]